MEQKTMESTISSSYGWACNGIFILDEVLRKNKDFQGIKKSKRRLCTRYEVNSKLFFIYVSKNSLITSDTEVKCAGNTESLLTEPPFPAEKETEFSSPTNVRTSLRLKADPDPQFMQ
ncbi:hypothetical protein GH714_037925 [Hevea brasiliensis]|uniref:Uncharacterized protein n=1 Tax=Hevea brasiliensis TaxID=3981 RepID=A0A6A6M5Y1_HEVBR|nr:hypothetical protein GH714_037925 [Hevea brasiliensis]